VFFAVGVARAFMALPKMRLKRCTESQAWLRKLYLSSFAKQCGHAGQSSGSVAEQFYALAE
jgi:hypothetical protein